MNLNTEHAVKMSPEVTPGDESMDIATLWQLCLQFEYDKAELVAGLEEWLEADKKRKVLDCACGTGFPSLDLLKRGYNIVCTDGSVRMLTEFRKNASAAGIDVVPTRLDWNEVGAYFNGTFDVVMCRGSSLIYAGVWDSDAVPDSTAIEEAVWSFRGCLKKDGILYVDTTAEANLRRTEPERNAYPERVIGNHRVSLSEVIETNTRDHYRTWISVLTVDGRSYEFERHSYYLPHDELIEILVRCGFDSILKERVRGEHYDVFTARKTE